MIKRKNKRVIATILVAVIAISGITVAFAASGKQGYISPEAILPGAITSLHIKDDDIRSGDIHDGTVDTNDIAGNAVTSNEIAGNSVNSGEIIDGEVKSGDIDTGAVTSNEIADNAVNTGEINDGEVKSGDIDTGAVNSSNIEDGTVESIDIVPNIIPTVGSENATTMSTSSSTYKPKEVSWNTSMYLPPRDTDYNLSVYWTGNDTWVSDTATELLVRCQLKCQLGTTTMGPNEYKIADDTNSNLTTSCVFAWGVSEGTTAIISIQIRSNNSNLVGINNQYLFAAAYPGRP